MWNIYNTNMIIPCAWSKAPSLSGTRRRRCRSWDFRARFWIRRTARSSERGWTPNDPEFIWTDRSEYKWFFPYRIGRPYFFVDGELPVSSIDWRIAGCISIWKIAENGSVCHYNRWKAPLVAKPDHALSSGSMHGRSHAESCQWSQMPERVRQNILKVK